ncbi:cell division protein FtsA [Ligilactobacillus ceti]|uniref:Cell division protein FtsA n=1 Tax=Ligilactobacillus ceti DSM 22408 TaxID=1122146 RepID=A0A0R2KI00_9LACO|nr:cell division protein FtsA [Ligilactobacillus ceti]KRN88958.1 cell division protein [Ligilactobacillus ceti DSM 22408]
MDHSGIYVGLDIGTTSIKVIVAEYIKKQLNIIGYGNTRSAGLNRGVIVDIDQVVEAIKNVIKQAEQKANKEITKVTVGIPANLLQIEQCQGMISVANEDGNAKEIDANDVIQVTKAALVKSLPPERDVIDVIPDEFIVDGFDGIKDPRGMVGVRMEMKAVMYTGPKTILHNIKKCVQKAGLEVKNTVVAPLAMAHLALSDAEQDFGTILIDLGGGQTTAAVIHDHKLKYTYVDQEGGDYVTRDISIVLNTSMENAEKIKRTYGYAHTSFASPDDVFPVEVVGQQEPEQVSEEYLAEIIEARMVQILEKLNQALESVNALQLPGGIVLTGGMAAIPGIRELAEDILGVNVKIYIPEEMNLRFPAFTQVIGLVDYVTDQSEIEQIVTHTLDKDYEYEEINEDDISIDDVEDYPQPKKVKKAKRNKKKKNKSGLADKFKGLFSELLD